MSETGDQERGAGADREPTPEEEAAAERAASGVDIAQVAEHYEEMSEIGSHVRGEGQIDDEPGEDRAE